MCVIFLAYQSRADFPLILLANRDEFYDRPTLRAEYWSDFPDILAGRDLIGGGTWLGITKTGRFAAVTNYRDPDAPKGTNSRGELTADFLKSHVTSKDYLLAVQKNKDSFSGFNLLVGEVNASSNEIYYFSNREDKIKKLKTGIYGLSNHLLDTNWNKVERGKLKLKQLLTSHKLSDENFFRLLNDKTPAPDRDLPDTGIGYDREKLLSPIFIETPVYGTRCSTVLTIDRNFAVNFNEKTYV